ncbi:hypothetical protein A0U40_06535 [[Bacillus] sp. KCTC 13219]|nr:hypothetical protein A0U40_06535 [[Bacillus] sp. KCTC 13219]
MDLSSINGIEFSPVIREDVLQDFKLHCRDSYEGVGKLFAINNRLDKLLMSKVVGDSFTKEYVTRLMNIRVADHYVSSLLLVSQGFIVDAISLLRASLEDLLVMINFEIYEGFFEAWEKDEDNFKIYVAKLRENVNNSSMFTDEDKEFFEKVYKGLCEIVHPKMSSIRTMASYHTRMRNTDVEKLIKYSNMVLVSYYTYQYQLCNFLSKVYSQDEEEILAIKATIADEININTLLDKF